MKHSRKQRKKLNIKYQTLNKKKLKTIKKLV